MTITDGVPGRPRPREDYRSPFLDRPGAVPAPAGDPDTGVPWHFTDPHGEQRRLLAGEGLVDLSHRGVLRIDGPDRLGWLHSLTTADIESLPAGGSTTTLILDPHGRIEHELHVADDGLSTWVIVEPGAAPPLAAYLDSMRFLLQVDVVDVAADWAVVWEPTNEPDPQRLTWLPPPELSGASSSDEASRYVPQRPGSLVGREVLVPRPELAARADAAGPLAGSWAMEALRVAAAWPRVGLDTDDRTIPHEVGLIGAAVAMDKGCYRGQETVARTFNLGRPPRRLVLLHLDGSVEALPGVGAPVLLDGRAVGTVGSSARHVELGPIALALVKRSTASDAVLLADGIPGAQEIVVVP